MDAVFGVSLSRSTVSLVLVEGYDADGATIDHETFDMQGGVPVAEAVTRIEAAAANQGHRVRVIGVTSTPDTDADAAELLNTLADAGFDNVVPVRLPQATDALAREIAAVVGFDTTAVCIIERDGVYVHTVNLACGSMQSSVNQVIAGTEQLIDWLRVVFATATRRPEALVVVGSTGDLDAMLPTLQDALDISVFTPAEARQPLARGAALVAARRGRLPSAEDRSETRARAVAWRDRVRMVPVAVLAGGAVTFVGSLALAVGLQMSPKAESEPTAPSPAANTSGSIDPLSPPLAPPLPAQAGPVESPAPEAPAASESGEQAAQFIHHPPGSQPAAPPVGAPEESDQPPVVGEPSAGPLGAPPGPQETPPQEQEVHQQVLPVEPVPPPEPAQSPEPPPAPPNP